MNSLHNFVIESPIISRQTLYRRIVMPSVPGAAWRLELARVSFTSSFVTGEQSILLSSSVKASSTSLRRVSWAASSSFTGWRSSWPTACSSSAAHAECPSRRPFSLSSFRIDDFLMCFWWRVWWYIVTFSDWETSKQQELLTVGLDQYLWQILIYQYLRTK